jgi:hypothetical protein
MQIAPRLKRSFPMKNSERLEQCIFFISQTVEAEAGIVLPTKEPTQLRHALLSDFDRTERFPTDAELRGIFKNPQAISDRLRQRFPWTVRFIWSFYV